MFFRAVGDVQRRDSQHVIHVNLSQNHVKDCQNLEHRMALSVIKKID